MHRDESSTRCELCGRRVPQQMITLHHLTPKERGGKAEHRVPMCRPCHKQIHAIFDNRELEAMYNDLPSLRATPQLQSFIKWIRKQPPSANVTTRQSNDHPHARRRR